MLPLGFKTRGSCLSSCQLPHSGLHDPNYSASLYGLGGLPAGIPLPSDPRHQPVPASRLASVDSLGRWHWSSLSFGFTFLQERHYARSRHRCLHLFSYPISVVGRPEDQRYCERSRTMGLTFHGLDDCKVRTCFRNTDETMLNPCITTSRVVSF